MRPSAPSTPTPAIHQPCVERKWLKAMRKRVGSGSTRCMSANIAVTRGITTAMSTIKTSVPVTNRKMG